MHALTCVYLATFVLIVKCYNETNWSDIANVTISLAKLATSTEWFDPEVSGEPSVFRFAIKFNYDTDCSSKEHFKRNTETCLRKHAITLADDSSGCKIVVTGNQWVNTYQKIFRNITLHDDDEAHFLRVKTCDGQLAITDFIILPSSQESAFKYLPFEMNHFRRLIQFEVPPSPTHTALSDVFLDTVDSCLPDRNRFIDQPFSNNTFQCVNSEKNPEMNSMLNLLRKPKGNGTGWPNTILKKIEHTKVNFMKNPYSRNPYSDDPEIEKGRCKTSREGDTLICSAANHLSRSKRHLYMIAMYVQVFLLADYLDYKSLKPSDLQLCVISDMSHIKTQRWFYQKLTASFTGHGNSPTLLECCRMTQKLKVYGVSRVHNFRWHCHDPYRVPNLILLFVNIGSYLFVLVFPLLVRLLPNSDTDIEPSPGSDYSTSPVPDRPTDRTGSHAVGSILSNHTPEKPCDAGERVMTSSMRSDSIQGAAVAPNTDTKLQDAPCNGNKRKSSGDVFDFGIRDECCLTKELDIKSRDLVFLDRDPFYRFGLKTIISCVLMFHIDNHFIIIARRFLFLYITWVLVHFSAFIVNFYYPSLAAHYQVISYGTDRHYYEYGTANSQSFFKTFYVLVFILPLIYSSLHFMCLVPVLWRKAPISQSLFWDESTTDIGKFLKLQPQSPIYEKYKPFEIRFYRAMLRRLKLLSRKHFWQYMLEKSMVEIPLSRRRANTNGLDTVVLIVACFIKLPAVLLAVPFYVLPCFTFSNEMFLNQGKFLEPSICRNVICRVCLVLLFCAGILLSFALAISFGFLYGSMVVFVFVDIVRNLRANVNHGVLFVSVLLYIQNAFERLQDQYRTMKKTIFKVCREVEEEGGGSPNDTPTPCVKQLIWTSENGEKAICKSLFVGVCNQHRSYSSQLWKTSFTLLLNLSLVFFLYVLVIDFQALDQFTGIGQSLMTIFTVSLPGLIGKLKSEAAAELDEARLHGKVKATVKDLVFGEKEQGVGGKGAVEHIWRRGFLGTDNLEWV